MLRLTKFLKPYLLILAAAIVLLFAQANAELALPDYLSRIVSVGIQQQGITSPVPEALRQADMDRLLLFATPEEQQQILSHYNKTEPDSKYLQTFPALSKTNGYVYQGEINGADPALRASFTRLWLLKSGIEAMAENKDAAAQAAQQLGLDPTAFQDPDAVFAALQKMPEPARLGLIARVQGMIDQQLKVMGVGMGEQQAIHAVKSAYESMEANTNQKQTNYILVTGGIMLLISLASVVSSISVGFLSSRLSAGVARDLRKAIFEKVMRFSHAELESFSTASLITRSTNDINQIQTMLMMMVRMVFFAPMMGIGGTIRAMSKGASMWWLIAIAVAFLMIMIGTIFMIALPRFQRIQKLVDRLNLVTRENLSGLMVVRAFNQQAFEENRFDDANKDLTDTSRFISRVMFMLFPTMTLLMNGLSVMIIWIGSHQVASGSMQVGDMMAFMQYAMQIVFSFMMISFAFFIIPRAAVSGRRIAEVLDTPFSIVDPQQPKEIPQPLEGRVRFENVSFRYPDADENVVCNVSFSAKPGTTTAIIGSTGSGKSTLINLIPRFFDVTEGRITIDDIDIRELSQHDLRQQIGYIPQKSVLFTGTLESNLHYANEEASEQDLLNAMRLAQANELLEDKTEGLESAVSQGGSNLSGGQRQRMTIARALVKDARIIIFDDSFSALDYKTDAALRRTLSAELTDRTILIVSQRISTIKNADQIIVLNEGEVEGIGTHADLLQTSETYREIATSQLSEELL